jgi:ATP-dependent helicase HrpA
MRASSRSPTCRSARRPTCASRSSTSPSTARFLLEPLPHDAASFGKRLEDGRGRLTLIANEVARSAAGVLSEYAAAVRKLKDARPPKDVAEDIGEQLARLVPKRFLVETPWPQLRTCRGT